MLKKIPYRYLIIFIVFVGILFLFFNAHRKIAMLPLKLANQPDSFAMKIDVVRYDHAGQMATHLLAPKMIHYPNNNLSIFISPQIILYNAKTQPWVITADKGFAHNGFDQITLKGHVVIHQVAGKNNDETTITTEVLIINGQDKTAQTDKEITMYQKNNNGSTMKMTATGMQANQKTGEIKLLSHTRGFYVPSNTE
jgi:lipopolysaccharide export system protein LptC